MELAVLLSDLTDFIVFLWSKQFFSPIFSEKMLTYLMWLSESVVLVKYC